MCYHEELAVLILRIIEIYKGPFSPLYDSSRQEHNLQNSKSLGMLVLLQLLLLISFICSAKASTFFGNNTFINNTDNMSSGIETKVGNITVDGLDLFYREAGDVTNPTVLLLHGYPSSSHQYRNLIPILARKYHVLAPDYPGFGFTTVPASRNYSYTFDSITTTTSEFLSALNIKSYIVYIFDYGAPVGLRLALRNPSAIRAIISQNGNAYLEGIGPAFAPLIAYYDDPSNATNEQNVRAFTTYDATKGQYTVGTPDPSVIEPESYTLDAALLQRPGNVDIQLAFFRDYKTNVALYPQFQAYLRDNQPPVLAVWGENDQFFIPPGAQAFTKDVPSAEVKFLDAGHFVLETNLDEVASAILNFLARKQL